MYMLWRWIRSVLFRLARLERRVRSDVALALVLGRGWSDKALIAGVLTVIYPFARRIGLQGKLRIRVSLRLDQELRLTVSERAHITQILPIWTGAEYSFPSVKEQPTNILDIGANIGVTTLKLHSLYQNARIFAFEPHPENFGLLSENIQGLSRVRAFRRAVSDRDGSSDFFFSPGSSISASLKPRGFGRHEVVECATLDTIIRECELFQIDILKLDVEGAEMAILRESCEWRKRVKSLMVEVHEELMDGTLDEFIGLFDGFRLTVRRISENRYVAEAQRREL